MKTFRAKSLLSVLFLTLSVSAVAQPRHVFGTPHFIVIPGGNTNTAMRESARASNIPLWSSSFVSGGQTFNFTMVGANPNTSNATTSIPIILIPVKFKFGTTTISPTATACGDTASALTRIQKSPLLNNFPFVSGTTNVGNTQYPDAFQRANFWQSVGSVTPNYHTLLTPLTT